MEDARGLSQLKKLVVNHDVKRTVNQSIEGVERGVNGRVRVLCNVPTATAEMLTWPREKEREKKEAVRGHRRIGELTRRVCDY